MLNLKTGDGGIFAQAKIVLIVVAVFWGVEVVNLLTGHSFNQFGIVPRRGSGLIGILLCPFLHANVFHLLSNTVPFVVMGWMVSTRGRGIFVAYTFQIMVIGGLLVWCFGQSATHIGASGVVFGYFGFVVASALFEKRPASMLLALVTIVLYSGMLWGVLPATPGVSWEGHLFGLIAGVLVARLQTSPAAT